MTGRVCEVPHCGRPVAAARSKLCEPHRADYLAHRREVTERAKAAR